MPSVNVDDLAPGTTAITFKGQIYTADGDGNIEIDDEDFDPETVKDQGKKDQAVAEQHNRMAHSAEPTVEPKEEKGDAPAPAGQSDAEASTAAPAEGDQASGHRRGRS